MPNPKPEMQPVDLIESAPEAIIIGSPQACIQRMNGLARKLARCSQGEQEGVPLADLFEAINPGEDGIVFSEMAEGEIRRKECALRCKGRPPVRVEVACARLGDGRFQIIMRDISEANRVERERSDLAGVVQALHLSEQRLWSVISNVPVVLFVTDREGLFTLSAGKGLETLGLKAGEVVGQSVYECYRDFPAIHDSIRRALEGDSHRATINVYGHVFEVWYEPHRGEGGAIEGVIGVATDISEQRRLEEQWQQSQKMEAIGRLAGGVAHDFNNLLTVIMGNVGLALAKGDLAAGPLESLHQISAAAERGSHLTRQLLTFGRKHPIQAEWVDLNEVVSGMTQMLRRLIGEDIELQCAYGASLPGVLADARMLEQVLLNLALNARDAMPNGGVLTVSTRLSQRKPGTGRHPTGRKVGHYVCLEVEDTGCGIAPDIQGKIFEPFFSTKEVGKGSGLGLASVYGIIQQHHGWVDVESKPEQGTVFKVFLPEGPQPSVQKTPAGSPPALSGGNELILVVEDEQPLRRFIDTCLRRLGYRVLAAANAREALVLWADCQDKVALVLTDVVMPGGMNGVELAERLRRDRADLKVIFTSGYSRDAADGAALETADNFLPKPFRPAQLADILRAHLDGPPVAES